MVTATSSADAAEAPLNTTSARRRRAGPSWSPCRRSCSRASNPASAGSAKAALTATIKPAKAGRPVALQVQKGSKWKTVSKTKLTKKGRAEFGAPISKGGKALNYRVTAAAFKGAKAVTSKPASTSRWLTASFTDEFSGSTLWPSWNHRGPNYEPDSLRECSHGDPQAVSVTGGTARLSVIKDPARASEKCVAKKDGKSTGKYAYRLNGHIGTEGNVSMKYGFAAARIKMHKLRGQHGGFWMQPADAGRGFLQREEHRRRDRRHRVLRRQAPRGRPDVVHLLEEQHRQGRQDRLVDQGLHVVPREQEGRLVEELPRLLRGVDARRSTSSASTARSPGAPRSASPARQQFPILSLLSSDYEISQMKGGDAKLPQTHVGRLGPPLAGLISSRSIRSTRTATRRSTSVGRRVSHA